MSRVMVTGGLGFIGGHLVDNLVVRGDDVTVVDNVPLADATAARWGTLARTHASYACADVRDRNSLARAMTGGVDVIYHLAAVVGVDQYLSRPLDVIDITLSGTRNVLELAAHRGAKVVVASTSEIFGKNPAVPWREDSDRVLGATSAARWTYASAKALAEHLTLAFANQHGLEATIVRYFNVYGSRQRPAYILSRSIHRALNGRAMVVYDLGRQTRCFTFVDDAVAGTVLAAGHRAAVGETFNIGSTTETTVAAAMDLVAELTGFRVTVAVDTQDRLGPAYEDLTRRVPDTTKARSVLGWTCETTLREGLVHTVEWARTNPWWLALPDSGATAA